MTHTTDAGLPPEPPAAPGARAGWLIETRRLMDNNEAAWLDVLGAFDASGDWQADGHLTCAQWLRHHTGMSRQTAADKVRVARQLRHRPLLADAFRTGKITYCAARAITRAEEADPDVDTRLIHLARVGTIDLLERAVRHYRNCRDQNRPPHHDFARRRISIHEGYDGIGTAELVLTNAELAELRTVIDTYLTPTPTTPPSPEDTPNPHTPKASPHQDTPTPEPPHPSSHEDTPTHDHPPETTWSHWSEQRADALMDALRTALTHHHHTPHTPDTHMIHLVRYETPTTTYTELLGGAPLHPAEADTLTCDAPTVTHHTTTEPLHLHRRTRHWNTAQRRAITIRDGGHCRYPGCDHRTLDIHHLHPWNTGGPTNIDNGACLCRRHHTLLHAGYTTTGNPNHALTFHRPDHTTIGTTHPTTTTLLPLLTTLAA